MENETIYHLFLAFLNGVGFYIAWLFLRHTAITVCRDGMLKQLDQGKKVYGFQRKFCGIHPTENRPL